MAVAEVLTTSSVPEQGVSGPLEASAGGLIDAFMDIATLCAQFCDEAKYLRGYSPDTIRRHRIVIEIFGRMLGLKDLGECTPARVQEFFYRGRRERHWTPTTYATYLGSLSVFFGWCRRSGHLQGDPLSGIERPRPQKRLPKGLTREQAERLLETTLNFPWSSAFERYRNHALLATVIYAGLRRKELLRLHLTDVDVAHQTIFVRLGKGQKDRIVPMNAGLSAILERYLQERAKASRSCPEVFTAARRNEGLTNIGLRWVVDRVRQLSGIAFGLHQLRHTFATLMLEGGCDIYALSRMMGHANITTTTIYLSASTDHLRAQVAKHPLGMGGARPAPGRDRWDQPAGT